jgi:hypothetical protein
MCMQICLQERSMSMTAELEAICSSAHEKPQPINSPERSKSAELLPSLSMYESLADVGAHDDSDSDTDDESQHDEQEETEQSPEQSPASAVSDGDEVSGYPKPNKPFSSPSTVRLPSPR